MVIYGVSFDMVGKQPIVLLKTVDSNKFLPIWIGHPEAAAILMKLQGASTPRPMTHDLLVDVLGELEAKCTQVSVTELRDNTFFATITLSVDGTRDRDRLAAQRRARARRPRRRADLRRRGGHRRVGDRVRARGRGHRGGRRHASRSSSTRSRPEDFAGGQLGGALRTSQRPTLVERQLEDALDQRSKPMPAASAACGSRLVSVRPGIALASST